MFSSLEPVKRAFAASAMGMALALPATLALAQPTVYEGIGRPATPKEVAAWDIDVRPDLKGLPPGKGSVAQGQDIWEAKCASCHGVFGEANEVFSPLIGGTTAEDVKTGRVARLLDTSFPGRTTFMKVPTLSTVFDYIKRAMPWNAPKSLSDDEVYAVTAYMLNLAGVVDDKFELSQASFAQAQARLPNRNGMRTDHSMWPGRGITPANAKPDVKAVACMNNCVTEPKLASFLPDHARDAHGNLNEQNRLVGAQKGAVTVAKAAATATAAAQAGPSAGWALAQKLSCNACHGLENRVVGPGFKEVATKHAGRSDAAAYLGGKIKAGSTGVWGQIPMPPQNVSENDLKTLVQWLSAGAPK